MIGSEPQQLESVSNVGVLPSVLVVDDDVSVRCMLKKRLISWGYRVECAADGREAWAKLQEDGRPDLILLDWLLPDIEGVELCRRIRCNDSVIPAHVIMLTVRSSSEDIVLGLESGADDYICKPFDANELRGRLDAGSRIIGYRKSLYESEAHYRQLVESARSIIIRFDRDGKMAFCNGFGRAFIGYCPLLGKEPAVPENILRELNCESCALRDAFEKIRASPSIPVDLEARCFGCDGALKDLAWSCTAVMDANGNFAGALCIGNDITENKRMEMALFQSDHRASVGMLASGLAHRFNNINATIRGYADMLLLDKSCGSNARGYAGKISQSVVRATDLIDRLINYAYPGKPGLDKCRVGKVAEDMADLLHGELEINGVELSCDFKDSRMANISEHEMGEIVLHLMKNAIQAVDGRPQKWIDMEASDLEGGGVSFSVSDTGVGMDRAEMKKVFLPFYTTLGEFGRQGTARIRQTGFGLGLSVCDSIIREYGGRIEVESELGKGSRFTVILKTA